jgi:hypothetical protein
MKRIFALSGVALLFCASLAYAEESVLINFSELIADQDGQNSATMIDFSAQAGTAFTDDERALMVTSLAIENWTVELNSSARTVVADRLSTARTVQSAFFGEPVMGVRIHFPSHANNANALVKPPFPIPALEMPEGEQEDGTINNFNENRFLNKGFVQNVGTLKIIEMNVRGLNFPHTVSVLLERIGGKIEELPLGSLDYDGWKTLSWTNPSYAFEVRQRNRRVMPVYPHTIPFIKLNGIRFSRSGMNEGGDFIAYIKDIIIIYDKAVRDDVPVDIDDEAVWHIFRDREIARREAEMRRLGEREVFEFVQSRLMDTSRPTTFPAYGTIPVNNRVASEPGDAN